MRFTYYNTCNTYYCKEVDVAWLLLVASLSGGHGALRLRLWRSVKALGAAVLRDGVYLAPATEAVSAAFEDLASEVTAAQGSAFVFTLSDSESQEDALSALFDRSEQYENLVQAIDAVRNDVGCTSETEARRRLRQLNRELAAIESTDFFPGKALQTAAAAFEDARRTVDSEYSPEEPVAIHAAVPRCNASDFQGKVWATRAHLWVDRVCSAWLIRRFVDSRATFAWLEHAPDCPASAIGFDFDGARFTHVDEYVTFEVLMLAFGLDADSALQRIAALVHYLDVGGGRVPEAAGFELILTGARSRCANDDALLDDMSAILDDMYRAFEASKGAQTG